MRAKLFVLVLLVAFATALTVLVSPAAAWPGPHHRLFPTTTTQAAPVPAADVIPKTPAMLPASSYPWVQPVWTRVHGVVVVKAPTAIQSVQTEPTWIGLG